MIVGLYVVTIVLAALLTGNEFAIEPSFTRC